MNIKNITESLTFKLTVHCMVLFFVAVAFESCGKTELSPKIDVIGEESVSALDTFDFDSSSIIHESCTGECSPCGASPVSIPDSDACTCANACLEDDFETTCDSASSVVMTVGENLSSCRRHQ